MITNLLGIFFSFSALGAFEVPRLTGPVVDRARLISPKETAIINRIAEDFKAKGKGQIQVLTVQSLEGEAIESATLKVVEAWKLGTQKGDDGILLLISAEEKKIRIEVGQGLEGVIPDVVAKRIISDSMVPLIRQRSVSEGVLVGVFQIAKQIDPEYEVPGYQTKRFANQGKGLPGWVILIIVIGLIISSLTGGGRRMGARSGWGSGGFGGGGGWSGGSGGGGFGGGGWSGGGGGFSGGGASGGW